MENGETPAKKAYVDVLRYRLQSRKPNPEETASFTFIDLFAGIGGMRRGFESAGGRCVFTSEWDKYSQQTYNANFSDEHQITGDITEIDAVDIPEHDVLLAGFPCQPFSIAGVSEAEFSGARTRVHEQDARHPVFRGAANSQAPSPGSFSA